MIQVLRRVPVTTYRQTDEVACLTVVPDRCTGPRLLQCVWEGRMKFARMQPKGAGRSTVRQFQRDVVGISVVGQQTMETLLTLVGEIKARDRSG